MAAPHKPLDYRPDIDGLRAVAVLAVIWFHAGLPGTPGGFTGVDIFFVISGYLITGIIHRDAREGRFSFARFYERRFRRIAPALITVTAATLATGYILLLPYELDDLARSAIATVGLSANIYFWRTTNYFALIDAVVPLRHAWSLGVEEQFYLLFPAALVIAERFGKAKAAIGLLGISSFILCVAATDRWPVASFYLLPTRGWELMIGAALAVGLVPTPRRAVHAMSIVGAALMLGGIVFISGSEPFPSWRALVPTAGAALVIGSGRESATAQALGWRPLVYVGRLSYSFYLWHWPVFAFLRHWRADLTLSPLWAFAGIGLAFALSALSYRWIEQPGRRRSTAFRGVLIPTLAGAAAILVASAVAIAGRGLPQRLPERVDAIAAVHEDRAPYAHDCVDVGFAAALEHCRLGPPGPPNYLLWGDSHAAAIAEGVSRAVDAPGLLLSTGACAPAIGWIGEDSDPRRCPAANLEALRFAVNQPQLTTVVLSAFWSADEHNGGTRFWRATQAVVDRLNAAGKRVFVVAGIPDPGADVPWAGAIRERFGRPPLRLTCAKPHVPLRNVTVIDVSSGFCRHSEYLLYRDSNHPSRYAGLAIISPAVRGSRILR